MASLSAKGNLQLLKIVFHQSYRQQLRISTSSTLRSVSDKAKESLAYQAHSPHHSREMEASAMPLSSEHIKKISYDYEYEPTIISNSATTTTRSPKADTIQASLESNTSFDQEISKTTVRNPEIEFSRRDLPSVLLNQVDPRSLSKVYYFDSLAFTKRLEARGFTRDQAEASVECLLEIIGTTLEHQAKNMITKAEQKIAEQQLQTEIMSVKKDMVLLQKSEFSALRTETEKISSDIARIESHFQDEVVKLKGHFTLDVNLERGRAVEAHAVSEKNLQMLNNKIETEIAHLKTTYEIYRNDIFKYAAGTVLTCTTLIIGFIRLWT